MKHKKPKNFIALFFANLKVDLGIKILSLFLAIIFFLFVSLSQLSEKSFTRKINITGLPQEFTIANSIPEFAKVSIKDTNKVISRISEDDFSLSLDLSECEDKGKGRYQAKVQYTYPRTMNSFFSSIKVVPEIISVDIENIREKNVPVTPTLYGYLKNGYMIRERKISPSSIRIKGAETHIDSVQSISTERIDMSDAYQNFERNVKLTYNQKKINIIGTDEVHVSFKIDRKMEMKTIIVRSIRLLNLDNNFTHKLINDPISVLINIPDIIASAVTEKEVVITVDASRIDKEGIHDFANYDIKIPDECSVISVTPKTLSVQIDVANPSH